MENIRLKKNKNEKKEGVQYQVWGRVDCSSGNRLGEQCQT